VSEDVRGIGPKVEPIPVALPAVPVRAADTTADDLGDGTVGVRFGSIDVLYGQRFLELL
jgi:hypothetical protein